MTIRKTTSDRVITNCKHTDKPYYAKGMCFGCYHARGRTMLATDCEHTDRPLYAFKICKNCYLSSYHKLRRQKNK